MSSTNSIYLLLTAFCCCQCRVSPGTPDLPYAQMQEGDLVFRCGQGLMSRAVTTAEQEGLYSHVGVLFFQDGAWQVVHAVPGEREGKEDFDKVKMERADAFFAPQRALRGCLVHTGLTDSTALAAMREKALRLVRDSTRFDNDYNLADTTELYCTELVWQLYRTAGKDLTEGRRRQLNMFRVHGDCILPEHIYHYRDNHVYFQY